VRQNQARVATAYAVAKSSARRDRRTHFCSFRFHVPFSKRFCQRGESLLAEKILFW